MLDAISEQIAQRTAKMCDRLAKSEAPASHCALVIRALAKEPTR